MRSHNAEPISLGVIAAGGSASRMWPSSKMFPKELFPLGRYPALIYILWEMAEAGITDVIIVASPEKLQIVQQFIDPSIPAPGSVQNDPIVVKFQNLLRSLKLTVLAQRGPYGNGTPLLEAVEVAGDRPCIYAFGDDIVLGENASAGLMKVYAATGAPVLAAQRIEAARTPFFGILECELREGINYVKRIIEKPELGKTRSCLASLGRYVVTPNLIAELRNTPSGRSNEFWFVDSVIKSLERGNAICVHELGLGRWFTIGDPEGFCQAVAAAYILGWNLVEGSNPSEQAMPKR